MVFLRASGGHTWVPPLYPRRLMATRYQYAPPPPITTGTVRARILKSSPRDQ